MIRVAVIGCGAIALEHLAYLAEAPLVDLVGVCDSSPAAADFARQRAGAREAFTDAQVMLDRTSPDVVHVLTPPHTHGSIAAAAAAAGSHVICEKPAAASLAELDEMLATAEAAGRRFMESQNLRWNEPVVRMHDAVRAGRLGDVREIDVMLSLDLVASRFGDLNLSGPGVQLPGGAVHDFLPHLAYLFLHLGQLERHDDVTGRLWNASGNQRVGFDQLDVLITSGRVRGRLRLASDLAPDAFRVSIRGTRASIETDLYHPYERIEGGANTGKRVLIEHLVSGTRLAWSAATELCDKVRQFGPYHGMGRMLDDYYTRLAAGQPSPLSVAQMRSSAALVDAIVARAEEP
jgi:predicted dehydrogenase